MSFIGFPRARTRLAGLEPDAVSSRIAIAIIVILHVVALALLYRTEWNSMHGALALLTWGFLNFLLLAILRRPAVSAALSLAIIAPLILLSQFKFEILWTGLSCFDFLIIDHDTVAFLLAITPRLRAVILIAAILVIPLLIAVWRIDPFRVR